LNYFLFIISQSCQKDAIDLLSFYLNDVYYNEYYNPHSEIMTTQVMVENVWSTLIESKHLSIKNIGQIMVKLIEFVVELTTNKSKWYAIRCLYTIYANSDYWNEYIWYSQLYYHLDKITTIQSNDYLLEYLIKNHFIGRKSLYYYGKNRINVMLYFIKYHNLSQ